MRVTVDFDYSEVVGWVDSLTNKHLIAAKARALNKAAEQGRTAMVREVTREFALTSAQVRERMYVQRASAAAGRFVMEATLAVSGRKRAMNLIRFVERSVSLAQAKKRRKAGEGGTQTLRGGGVVAKALELRFQIKRSGGKQIIKGAFIGNKGRTVFIREGTGRLPIKALSTIDVPQMFNTKRINAKVVDLIRAKLPELMRHELEWALKQAAR